MLESIAHDSIERFVTSTLDRAGAVVEKPGYGLTEALLPEELVTEFAREELLLAFDYEVAQENPESTFVTPGSPLLDSVVRLARDYGGFTSLYWPGAGIKTPRNLEQKISEAVDYRYCRHPAITETWTEDNIYYGFYFLCTFYSWEKREEIISAVINGHSGICCPDFEEQWKDVVPLESPEYQLGQAETRPLQDLYQSACQHVGSRAQEKGRIFQEQQSKLGERELARTERYYAETLKELNRKITSTNDTLKKQRLKKQVEATRADWEFREKDIISRYQVDAELFLDHVVAYHVPCTFVRLEMQHKKEILQHTLLFNLLSREFEPPACPRCGMTARQLFPDNCGGLICSRHSKK